MIGVDLSRVYLVGIDHDLLMNAHGTRDLCFELQLHFRMNNEFIKGLDILTSLGLN